MLYDKHIADIESHQLPLSDFVQRENLSIFLQTYADKLAKGETRRSAVYELALKSNISNNQGDSVRFYIIGNRKRVVVTDNSCIYEGAAKEAERNENIPYYLDKLKPLRLTFDLRNGR